MMIKNVYFHFFWLLNLSFYPISATAETWNAADLYKHLKVACEVSYQVEEPITDSNGNVTRDSNGAVRTRWVTKTKIDRGCVPRKFSNIRIRQTAKFLETDKRTFGSDYVFFNAGPVDLKCKASESSIDYFKTIKKGTMMEVEGTLLEWEYRIVDDNFVMNCGM